MTESPVGVLCFSNWVTFYSKNWKLAANSFAAKSHFADDNFFKLRFF